MKLLFSILTLLTLYGTSEIIISKSVGRLLQEGYVPTVYSVLPLDSNAVELVPIASALQGDGVLAPRKIVEKALINHKLYPHDLPLSQQEQFLNGLKDSDEPLNLSWFEEIDYLNVADTVIIFWKDKAGNESISANCIYGVIGGQVYQLFPDALPVSNYSYHQYGLVPEYNDFIDKLKLLTDYKACPLRKAGKDVIDEELDHYASLFGYGKDEDRHGVFYRMGASILLTEKLNQQLGKADLKFKDEIESLLKFENTFKENEFENGYRSGRLDVAIHSEKDFETALLALKRADHKGLKTKCLRGVILQYLYGIQDNEKLKKPYFSCLQVLQKRPDYHSEAIVEMKFLKKRFAE